MLADARRAAAKERQSKSAADVAPIKAHCQVAKDGSKVMRPQLQIIADPGHPQLVSDVSCAVQRPIATPAGTEANRRMFVAMCLTSRCYFLDSRAAGRDRLVTFAVAGLVEGNGP